MEKKYQIFISSTYEDLIEERKAVQETILSMYQIPIGMEMFSADDDEQWEIIKETIDSSDYYVVIIGHKYGSLTKEGISYTRKEYEYARSIGVPTLGFIIDSNVPVKPDYLEVDQNKRQKLGEFVELVKQKPVEWWENKADLSRKVAVALQKQIFKGKRPGWIRADKFNIEETQNELIQLSRRNRELEEENKVLKGQLTNRMPKIVVTLSVKKNEILKAIPADERKRIESDIRRSYRRLTLDDLFEEQQKDDELLKEIEEYNSSLPNEQVLIEYIYDMIVHYGLNEGYGKNINIEISNDGNCKAKDINISLEFSSELIVKFNDDMIFTEEPEAPPKKENPLNKLYMAKVLGASAFISPTILPSSFVGSGRLDYSARFLNAVNNNHNYDLENNCIKIWEKDLLHKYLYSIDKYTLVALKPGNYKIKCTTMCEEYIEPVEQIIDFQVD